MHLWMYRHLQLYHFLHYFLHENRIILYSIHHQVIHMNTMLVLVVTQQDIDGPNSIPESHKLKNNYPH